MGTVLDNLRESVTELSALDPDTLTDTERHHLVIGTLRAVDQLTAALAPHLHTWDRRMTWALDGSKSSAARLARETGSARRTTNALLRRATLMSTMPLSSAAAVTGTLSIDRLDALATVNTPTRRDLFNEHEAELLRNITGLRHPDTRKAAAHWAQRADRELGLDDPTPDRQVEANRAHCSTTLDDMVALDALLDPISGTIVTDELDRLADQIRRHDLRDGVDRTPAQRRAAALVEMARRSATMPAKGRAPKPLFTILVGDHQLAHVCELANGTVIHPKLLVPYLTEAMLESILFDGPTTIISVSQKRTFTGALRRAIQVRDRHCQHPSGCDDPADDCDIDHITPASLGGPTAQWNGRLECAVHNRNTDKHDHDATPFPVVNPTRLSEQLARNRWKWRQRLPNGLPHHPCTHTT